jgi:fatty acid desaturase
MGSVGIAGVTGLLPYWLTVPITEFVVFAAYIPLHEVVHKNIQGQRTDPHWLNEAIGHLCSIPLLVDFKGHRVGHLNHHSPLKIEIEPSKAITTAISTH